MSIGRSWVRPFAGTGDSDRRPPRGLEKRTLHSCPAAVGGGCRTPDASQNRLDAGVTRALVANQRRHPERCAGVFQTARKPLGGRRHPSPRFQRGRTRGGDRVAGYSTNSLPGTQSFATTADEAAVIIVRNQRGGRKSRLGSRDPLRDVNAWPKNTLAAAARRRP